MLEAALFRHDRVPGNVLHLALHRLPVKIDQLHAGSGNHGHVAIRQKENIARVIKDGGNVGGDKIFIVAQTNDDRRPVARRDNLVGLIFGNHGQRKHTGK